MTSLAHSWGTEHVLKFFEYLKIDSSSFTSLDRVLDGLYLEQLEATALSSLIPNVILRKKFIVKWRKARLLSPNQVFGQNATTIQPNLSSDDHYDVILSEVKLRFSTNAPLKEIVVGLKVEGTRDSILDLKKIEGDLMWDGKYEIPLSANNFFVNLLNSSKEEVFGFKVNVGFIFKKMNKQIRICIQENIPDHKDECVYFSAKCVARIGRTTVLEDGKNKESMNENAELKSISKADASKQVYGEEIYQSNFSVDEVVAANFQQGEDCFFAKITKVNKDGTYDLLYIDDDEVEENVPEKYIHKKDMNNSEQENKVLEDDTAVEKSRNQGGNISPIFKIGDNVAVRYNGGTEWFAGRVADVRPENGGSGHYYDVTYDDGDFEANVAEDFIKAYEQAAVGDFPDEEIDVPSGDVDVPEEVNKAPEKRSEPNRAVVEASNTSSPGDEVTFKLHQAVEAEYVEDVWYSGRISAVHRDGTYDVLFVDGDTSENLPPSKIRASLDLEVTEGTGADAPARVAGVSAKSADGDDEYDDVDYEEEDWVEGGGRGDAAGKMSRVASSVADESIPEEVEEN